MKAYALRKTNNSFLINLTLSNIMDKQIKEYTKAGKKNLIILYILYLCGVVAPLLPAIGVIFAYINKEAQNNFLSSHYIFLFRTFCLGFLGFIIAKITMLVFIGLLVYFALAIWFILRVAIGFKYLLNDQHYPNPMTYWIK
jgi:uncharacterized membrane protein